MYDQQLSGGIQGNTVSPPSLSSPTSARGTSQGDTGGGFSRNSSYGNLTLQQRQQHSVSSSEGSGAQPLEYGSPPHVSRSGSWVTLANGSGSVNSSFAKDAVGSAVSGVASILSRPPSALAGSPQASGSAGNSLSGTVNSSVVDADPQKRAKLADYYHARGYAARKQGNFKGAVDEYTRALSLSPTHFKALFNRGFSFDKVIDSCYRATMVSDTHEQHRPRSWLTQQCSVWPCRHLVAAYNSSKGLMESEKA